MRTPDPVNREKLPSNAPEWDYITVIGGKAGTLLLPGRSDHLPVVRRLKTYGEWEPVNPGYWAPDAPTPADEAIPLSLAKVRALADDLLALSSDPQVWRLALTVKQLCMGTITPEQALAQVVE